MCGIAGVFDPKGTDADILLKMSGDLEHRGPDDEGYVGFDGDFLCRQYRGEDSVREIREKMPHISELDKNTILAFLHRRLSVIDLSSKGHQPFSDPGNQYFLTFNGEIYNYIELRAELEKSGCTFYSETDTEVVLHAIREWGGKAFEKFNGMWALAFFDVQSRKLILSRDRFGIKPLYYSSGNGGKFAFSSEIKPLLRLDFVSTKCEATDILEYIAYGTTAKAYGNLFSDIQDLKPGHYVIFDPASGNIEQHSYYRPGESKSYDRDKTFREHFEDAVKLHMRSDVEIGACLSGGLDSSALVMAMRKQSPEIKLHSFTAIFPDDDVDEGTYARSVSGSFNLEAHYTEPQARGMLEDMDKMLARQELPVGSSSVYAQWEVMKLAADHRMKVLIDGQGADETLGGYYNFAGLYLIGLLKHFYWLKFRKEYSALKHNFTPGINMAIARAAYAYLPSFLKRYSRKKQRKGMNLIASPYRGMLKRTGQPDRNGKSFREHSVKSLSYGLYELLRYEDRNSMAFSIESRVPFLDHRLVEYILDMPSGEKIINGWTKYPLRKYMNRKLPDHVVWRKDKKGFVTPQEKWKELLLPEIKKYFHEAEIPGLIDRKELLALCDDRAMENAHLSEFWRLYSLIRWMEQFNVSIQ